MDHFAQIGGIGKPKEPMLEGYSTLSYPEAGLEPKWLEWMRCRPRTSNP
jgi:hypothetical protein